LRGKGVRNEQGKKGGHCQRWLRIGLKRRWKKKKKKNYGKTRVIRGVGGNSFVELKTLAQTLTAGPAKKKRDAKVQVNKGLGKATRGG